MSRRVLFGLGFMRVLPDQLLEPAAPIRSAREEPTTDLDALKERARELWSAGDYRELGRALEPAALELLAAGNVGPGRHVLDVGAGDGNLALAAARRGAVVTACDLSPVLVDQGRRRSEADGQQIEWLVADAEALPFADDSFDVVGSCFGAMYAPRPNRVTAELFRVIRPGGTVLMTTWTSSGFMGRLLNIAARHLEHPPEVPRPAQWGRYETVYREFLSHTEDFESRVDHALPLAAESRAGMWEALLRHPGDLAAGLPGLGAEARERLRQEVLELIDAYGREADGSWVIDVEYELVVGRKPDLGC